MSSLVQPKCINSLTALSSGLPVHRFFEEVFDGFNIVIGRCLDRFNSLGLRFIEFSDDARSSRLVDSLLNTRAPRGISAHSESALSQATSTSTRRLNESEFGEDIAKWHPLFRDSGHPVVKGLSAVWGSWGCLSMRYSALSLSRGHTEFDQCVTPSSRAMRAACYRGPDPGSTLA